MFQKIEGSWPRREHFHHYMNNLRCTYSLTVRVEITKLRRALRQRGWRAYPAQIYMLANTVNRFPEFRMGLGEDGEPGFWERLHPAYTIFHDETKTFSSVWTRYDEEFARFYRACVGDMDAHCAAASLFPKPGAPPNLFDVSSVPGIDFTAFNLNVYAEGTHLAPIFTIGRYVERDGETWMPLAMQLHHAACDGYHASQFVEALRVMANDCDRWL